MSILSFSVSRVVRVLLCAASAFVAFAPGRVAAQSFSDDGSSGRLSPRAAQEVLEGFRNFSVTNSCLRFTITHVPRRGGGEVVHQGVLWTSWREGPIFRVELTPGGGTKDAPKTPVRFILKSGKDASLWHLDGFGRAARVSSAANKPFLPGLIITPLELQQPFTYWKDAKYVETRRFRGRPTSFFQMTPPEDFKLAYPELGFVRIGIDRGYKTALMQAMIYNAKGEELRKLEVESFAKVKEAFIPEELRFHDQVTRDKDIFRVHQAAVGIRLGESIFNPATLTKPAPQPEEAQFSKVD
jgi:hypothetical protein